MFLLLTLANKIFIHSHYVIDLQLSTDTAGGPTFQQNPLKDVVPCKNVHVYLIGVTKRKINI